MLRYLLVASLVCGLSFAQEPGIRTATVEVGGRTVLEVRAGIGSIPPQTRAAAIRNRIIAIARDTSIPLTEIRIDTFEGVVVITGGGFTITAISQEDAQAAQLPRERLAAQHLDAIRTAIAEYRENHVRAKLPVRIGQIALFWVIAAALLWLLGWLHRRLQVRLTAWRESLKQSADEQKVLKLMTATKLRGVTQSAYRVALAAAFLIFLPAAVTFTLRQFAATEELADTWIDSVRIPLVAMLDGFVDYFPNLLFLVIWIAVIVMLVRLNRVFWRWVALGAVILPGFHKEWADPTGKILAFLLVAFGLVVAFPYLPGGQSPAFQGVSIFIGVLVSLGSGSAMGNIVSGIILTYTRAFQIGDRIKVADHIGDVIERSLLVTRLRTIKNEDVVIPNSTVVNSAIVNYTEAVKAGGLILNTRITIGYDAPWQTVHKLMIDAALRTAGILPTPEPFVFQIALNDYNVAYEINAYTDRPAEMADIYSELHQHIQDTFNEGGVEILSPVFNAVRDGSHTTIPGSYLPADYKKPGFRVEPS